MSIPAPLVGYARPQRHVLTKVDEDTVYASCADCDAVEPVIYGARLASAGRVARITRPDGREQPAFLCRDCLMAAALASVEPDVRSWWWAVYLFRAPHLRAEVIMRLYRQGRLEDVQLWRALSQDNRLLPASVARSVYEELGFRPFAGYPLQPLKGGEQ